MTADHQASDDNRVLKLLVISAGTSEPSTTSLLAGRLAQHTVALARQRGLEIAVRTIELRTLAIDTASALVSRLTAPPLAAVAEALHGADGLIAATPIYKAGLSGIFKSFFDTLDDDLIIGKPVALVASAGTQRHALVADEQMRSLFAYLRALPIPTSVFAAPDDWADAALSRHIERAALELLVLMESGFAATIKREAWASYDHELDSAAGGREPIELDSELMRLAAGGELPPTRRTDEPPGGV